VTLAIPYGEPDVTVRATERIWDAAKPAGSLCRPFAIKDDS
jgi:hypothetical protein